MKNLIIFSVLICLFISCETNKNLSGSKSSKGQDGSSLEKAIFINKNNEMEGIAAEYDWLKKHYPGYKNLGQSLVQNKGKSYDILKIKTAGGQTKSIYFDISKFFGKY
jgi:hypothetical protein